VILNTDKAGLELKMPSTNTQYRIITDAKYGYQKLDPLPTNEEISQFYQKDYFKLIKKGGRAPELRRLMSGGKEVRDERNWLETTLYSDICVFLNRYAKGKHLLDVGRGTGDLILYLKKNGFDVTGIEPSTEAAVIAKQKSLKVYNTSFEVFAANHNVDSSAGFDAVVLINILEHVTDPVQVIDTVKKILKPAGILCVRVPNDFTEMQEAAQRRLNKERWWVAIPDHINYFNLETLPKFLKSLGFEILYSQSDFPMELFLLMGDDYVGNSDVGEKCHKKRVAFEDALPHELRRKFYAALASCGIGRDCLLFAKKNHS
jgi:2-polyprenyl-3-methyl-5-hydroxy-6-metoxy-1,4-benzoquinol methylase